MSFPKASISLVQSSVHFVSRASKAWRAAASSSPMQPKTWIVHANVWICLDLGSQVLLSHCLGGLLGQVFAGLPPPACWKSPLAHQCCLVYLTTHLRWYVMHIPTIHLAHSPTSPYSPIVYACLCQLLIRCPVAETTTNKFRMQNPVISFQEAPKAMEYQHVGSVRKWDTFNSKGLPCHIYIYSMYVHIHSYPFLYINVIL